VPSLALSIVHKMDKLEDVVGEKVEVVSTVEANKGEDIRKSFTSTKATRRTSAR